DVDGSRGERRRRGEPEADGRPGGDGEARLVGGSRCVPGDRGGFATGARHEEEESERCGGERRRQQAKVEVTSSFNAHFLGKSYPRFERLWGGRSRPTVR